MSRNASLLILNFRSYSTLIKVRTSYEVAKIKIKLFKTYSKGT